jgi:hypothetical protein
MKQYVLPSGVETFELEWASPFCAGLEQARATPTKTAAEPARIVL